MAALAQKNRQEGGSDWQDEYLLGIEEIDEQHRGLFEEALAIIAALHAANDQQEARSRLARLVDEARLHFAVEECLMRVSKYRRLKEHRREHNQFIERVTERMLREPTAESAEFVRSWLQDHIFYLDKPFAAFLLKDTPAAGQNLYPQRLIETVQELSMCQDMDGVMRTLARGVRRLALADGASVVLKDGDWCQYVEEDAIEPLWRGKRFAVSASIAGWAMLNREQVAIADIYQDARVPHDAYRATFVKSLVMTPVRLHDPIAAVGAYWSRERKATPQELISLQALADSAAVAITNVKLIEALKDENRRREQFISAMSHELRNPLTPLVNCIQLLQLHPENAQMHAKALEMMDRQVTHMSNLVEDLLQVSRLTSGKVELKRERLDLGELVRHAVHDRELFMARKGIALNCTAPDAPVEIEGDRTRLTQVLENLLHNADKFTPPGGSVSITLTREGSNGFLSIRDTGIGISSEYLPRIFGTFTKKPDTSPSAGLGLGLPISKSLIELHGGTISAFSEGEGRGCEMLIRLPLA